MVSEQSDAVRALLVAISSEDAEELINTERLGTAMNFAAWEETFRFVIDGAAEVRDLDWGAIPDDLLGSPQAELEATKSALGDVKSFDPAGGDDRQPRAGHVEARFNEFRKLAVPLLGYLTWKSVDVEDMRGQIETRAGEVRKSAEAISADLEKMKTDAESTLAAIRSAAGEAGVEHQAETF